MTTHVELRRGAYHDSVSLMQVSRTVAGTPGVTAAQVAMATELNVDVLRGMGFDVPGEAGPNDLVVALRADDADGLDAGLAAVADALAALRGTGDSGGGGDDEVTPRTLGSAAARSGANLAVISVPGQHAVDRGLRRHRIGDERDAVLRQRLCRRRGAAQGRRGRRRRARHGARLRHRPRRWRRPGVRQRRAPRLGRHRRGLGHRCPAGDVPARRRRRRPQPLPRRRWPRPQGRRRWSLHPAGARGPRRRPGHRDRARGVQAPGCRRARRRRGARRGARPAGALGGARPGPPRPHRGRRGVPGRRGPLRADLAGHPRCRRRPGPDARTLPARPVLRRHPGRRGDDGRGGDAGRHPQQHRARPRARAGA